MIDVELEKLQSLLDESKRAVVFTGAGISTESGIPDFRSPGGVWTTNQPIQFNDFMSAEEMRRETWRRKINTDKSIRAAEPNRGHRAVEKLIRLGKVSNIITQNIDGLHQESGVPDDQIIELHGNSTYATCLDCGLRHEIDDIMAAFQTDETLPLCNDCDSPYVKPATISFGQSMPEDAMQRARAATDACDLFISLGSSLVVYPAAGFPVIAKNNGARLVIVNRDPTEMDHIADLVLNREIGPTLGEVVEVN
ncbi:MAG: NAD-dependent deacetylase [Rhodospirillaceae bacterium]|jgi:NAD-dependent deacetylase|nr:NAD-dependent deacetylase [Rhodospirillaceae bacterium]MBT5810515.1 NAD-dependent deacetylase [Rhodospirillaceae bacterium]